MRLRRVRFTVRGIMILIVFIALPSALVIQSIRAARKDRERVRLVQLVGDFRRAADRLDWAERMYRKKYVSDAQLKSELLGFKKAEFALRAGSP